ncbi:MAG TPA: hypothetical protein VHM28_12245 [Anaerolineales bacterium]|jgi:hypothetical protein|nr:hypothetical protein [Anaerolineales bacterium]
MQSNKRIAQPKSPKWLPPVNQLVMALNRLGLAVGTQYILSVPGRKTGQLRSTPVALLTVDGRRYIVSIGATSWVKNARASGWGFLARGRKKERVALLEVPLEARGKILREFPRQVRGGVQFFKMAFDLANDPEAFAAAAPLCPVFRVDSLPAKQSESSGQRFD